MRPGLSWFPTRSPVAPPPLSRGEWGLLTGILLVAAAARLWLGVNATYIIHPDETWDYLEQGHRLAFGEGYVTWTYNHGMRSLLFPALIGAAMRAGSWFAAGYDARLHGVVVFMTLLALPAVAVAFLWGRREAGTIGGLITGTLAAIWYEFLYFTPHALSEVFAADLLVAGLYLATTARADQRARFLCAGLLLAVATYARIHIAPGVALGGAWLLLARTQAPTGTFTGSWRVAGIAWLIAGGGLGLLALGLLDWVTYRYPFQSLVMNVYMNIFAGVGDFYGRAPIHYFGDLMLNYWGGAFALIATLAAIGALRLPVPALVAAVIVAAHSLIGHKEYRFIYPALPLLMLLVGVGAGRLVAPLAARRGALPVALGATSVLFVAVTSLALATQGPFRREWQRAAGFLQASRHVATLPDVCGIGIWKLNGGAFSRHMGMAHPAAPGYAVSTPGRFRDDAASFNVLIAADNDIPADDRFGPPRCWPDGLNEPTQNRRRPHICVLVRPGGCVPGAISDPDPNPPPNLRPPGG